MKYRFLGSIWFAVPLIVVCAVCVAIATWLEGVYDSHDVASQYVYGHPLFSFLLFLFFVNILVSALNRWPWKKRHVPFLLTHLGLLMVIGGTIGKNVWGVQGNMLVAEGTASNAIKLPGTYALGVTEMEGAKLKTTTYPLNRNYGSGFPNNPLGLQLKHYAPHSEAELLTWIKPQGVELLGLPPLKKQLCNHTAPQMTMCRVGEKYIPMACVQTDDLETFSIDQHGIYFIESGETSLFLAVSEEGKVQSEWLDGELKSYGAYGRGFGGYTVEMKVDDISLEAPLKERIKVLPAPPLGERNNPAIVVEMKQGILSDTIALSYEGTFAWPVLDGKYLVKFGQEELEIPHKVRLRRAQKILYPLSNDVKSYLADVVIDDTFFQLKMNEVYETSDGYRFYLSQMLGEEGEQKKVNLVVNKDPFRYPLTYPGAAFISVGAILLLFRPRKRL